MNKLKLFITLILITATASILTAQQGRGPGERHRMGFDIDRLTKALELTDEQAEQIQQLHYESEKAAIDLKSALDKNRLEIRAQGTTIVSPLCSRIFDSSAFPSAILL